MHENRSLYEDYCTVGDLLDFIEKHKLPRDANIFLQRVEDVYFEKYNWIPVKKEGQFYNEAIARNKKIDSGEFHNKKSYPKLTPEIIESMRVEGEELESLKDQYNACWCPVKYPDDNNLYLDAHY